MISCRYKLPSLKVTTGVILLAGSALGGENLVKNPGFEQLEPDGNSKTVHYCAPGWSKSSWYIVNTKSRTHDSPHGTVGLDDTVAYSGRQSLRIQYLKEPVDVYVWSRDFPAAPGKIYVLTAWLRSDTGEVTAKLFLESRDQDGKHWYKGGEKVTVKRDWKQYKFMYELDESEILKSLHARIDFSMTRGTLWVDDVRVEQED